MKMPPASSASIDVQRGLEEAIFRCGDLHTLRELLDRQANIAAPSAKLDAHLRRFIDKPTPHLTAAVFRIYRYSGNTDVALHEAAAGYLSVRCYDGDWYDETINSIGWANELVIDGSRSPLVPAYRNLLQDAAERSHNDLLDFCYSYGR